MRRTAVVVCLLVASLAHAAPPAQDDIAKALASQDAAVRLRAVERLAASKDTGAVSRLLAQLGRETHPEILAALLDALGDRGDARATPNVAAMLSHELLAVRTAALTALSKLNAEDGRRAALHVLLHPRSSDPHWAERAPALLALARVARPEEFPLIARAYERGGGASCWLARSCFTRVVAALRPPDAAARLTTMLGDDDSRVAVSAAGALLEVGGAAMLLRHLDHRKSRVRIAVIGGLHRGAVRIAAPRLRRLARLDPDRGVRWASTLALWHFDDEAADDLVLQAMAARDPAVWMSALALLRDRLDADHGQDAEAWRKALAARRKAQGR